MYILVAAALLALTAACSSDHDGGSNGSRNEVRLAAFSSQTVRQTRAEDGLYTADTGFDGGEAVTVWMSSAAQPKVYQVGQPDAQHRSLLTAADPLLYPEQGDVTLYAVYPSTSTSAHTVKRDQSSTAVHADNTTGNANYKQSDLMYAKVSVAQADQDQAQELSFDHVLTKLTLTVVKTAAVGQVKSVTLNNVKRRVSLSPSATNIGLGIAEAVPSGDADYYAESNNSILLGGTEAESNGEETYTYCCVFPPQEFSKDEAFLTIEADDDTQVFYVDADSNKTLHAGEYTATVTVDAEQTGTAPLFGGQLATRSTGDRQHRGLTLVLSVPCAENNRSISENITDHSNK